MKPKSIASSRSITRADVNFRGTCGSENAVTHTNSQIGADPWQRTTVFPFHSSQASSDVEDISSSSATTRFSLARPMMAFSQLGPPTRMALMMIVMIPIGAIASRTQSSQQVAWLRNCIVTRSPNNARMLCCHEHEALSRGYRQTYGARSENKLFEKSSPSSRSARAPLAKVKRRIEA